MENWRFLFCFSWSFSKIKHLNLWTYEVTKVNYSFADPSLAFPNETAMVEFIGRLNKEDRNLIWGGIVFQVDTSESNGEEFPSGQITYKVSAWDPNSAQL